MGSPVVTLAAFYADSHERTPFTDAFLDGRNLLVVQQMLTERCETDTELKTGRKVSFSDAVIGGLIEYATRYHLAPAHSVHIVNQTFVDRYSAGIAWDANTGSFWKRWCEDGIPDPNTIPMPLPNDDKVDKTVHTSSYALSHPHGGVIPQF